MIQKQLTIQEAESFLGKLLRETKGVVPPVCLWGQHGIGKTELIRTLADRWKWPIRVIHPAQFEEMGDLLGLPYRVLAEGKEVSHFAPPEWVPNKTGPGILLIDDFNRADDRIIRGLMALLQERSLASWTLPTDWKIVLTANPEEADYAVTPIDDAIRSRMLHLHVAFSVESWVAWAEGQKLPDAGINFILQHPELIDGQATTARTFTYFLELWQKAGYPQVEDAFLSQLAHSALAPATAQAFIHFLNEARIFLPSPRELLAGTHNEALVNNLQQLLAYDVPRVDRISVMCNRLLLHLQEQEQPLNEVQTRHLKAFMLLEELPAEHRLLLLRGLSELQHDALPSLLQEPPLAALLIGG